MQDPDVKNRTSKKKLLKRLQESSFPPAALLGAFSSFASNAFQSAPEARAQSGGSLVQISFSEPQPKKAPTQTHFELEYSQALVLGAAHSAHLFRRSLTGIAVDSEDRIYALGDGEVRVFEPAGEMIRSWKVPDQAACLAISAVRVYLGFPGRVEIYDASGTRVGGFIVGNSSSPANVTAIKIYGGEILVADASVRHIRRFDPSGKQIGEIGTRGKTRGFMLPNRALDIDVDSKGVILATDTGRHRVTSWGLDGSPLGSFGKFGQMNPEDFVGCCNPVNLAVTRDGNIVTAEKVVPRVKVYGPEGKLLGLIGPEHFDAKCTHLHLAVDSRGRILVADPVRLEVKIFSAATKPGDSKKV